MEHKEIIFPHVELTPDDGDPRWRETGEDFSPVYKTDGTVLHYTFNGLQPGFWADYWQTNVIDIWTQTVETYEADPQNVHHAWWYIDGHPVFWKFDSTTRDEYPARHLANLIHEGAWQRGWPGITPHMINPETRAIEEDSRNTEVRWWYEFGPVELTGVSVSHDYELDGGASTYELCVLDIAEKIHKWYGNDRSLVDQEGYWENRKIET